MSTRVTSRCRSGTMESPIGNDPLTSQLRPAHLPNLATAQILSIRNSERARNEIAQLVADIDGVPVLVRFLVGDTCVEMRCHLAPANGGLRSLLSSTIEKMVERIGASPLQRDDRSKQTLAMVAPNQPPDPSTDTMLRIGSLELDLLDRTAKRGDRRIDLRPREFQLLRYMVQRADMLLTRAAILKDVWNYKAVPETNLVDVHMGKLRRKIDGPNDPPLIRNVRGVGFILSATAPSHCPKATSDGRADASPPDGSLRLVERALQFERSHQRSVKRTGTESHSPLWAPSIANGSGA